VHAELLAEAYSHVVPFIPQARLKEHCAWIQELCVEQGVEMPGTLRTGTDKDSTQTGTQKTQHTN
jgi:hypothetical protein